MAKNQSNKSQASSSTGFWETYDAEIPQPFSEYKKPNCEDDSITGKKKKSSKKPKPSPALASLLFHSGEEARAKSKYSSYEPPSGPNAWSMRSGAELFKEPPPDERRRAHHPSSRPGRFSPYYPEPQDDEEEQLRRAIEESMRSAREDEERKKRREKEEEEWLSQLCADLKKEDKSSSNVKMSSARQKVTRYSVSADSTDSDDFLNINSRSKSSTVGGKDRTKKTEPIQKQAEKKQLDKQNEKPKKQTDKLNPQPDIGNKTNEKKDFILQQTEREPFREMWDVRGEQQTSHGQKRFTTNLYDNYDDEPDESYLAPASSTHWPSRNESHKWNAETWTGDSSAGRNTKSQRNGRHDMARPQRQRNFRAEDLPDTRNKMFDSRHDPPKPPRNRNFQEEKPSDSRNEQEYNTFQEDMNRINNNLQSKGTVKSQGKLGDLTGGSPSKSRNFKQDFLKNQNEEAENKVDDAKHVKFSSVHSTHVISNSESETDSSSKTIVTDVFASSKIQFDENLYSNQYQMGKAVPSSRKSDTTRSQKPVATNKTMKPIGVRNEKPDTTKEDRPVPPAALKSSLSRNTWKKSLQSSEENERHLPTLSWMQQSSMRSDADVAEKEIESTPVNLNQTGKSDNIPASNHLKEDLGTSPSDSPLNDLAANVSDIHLNDLSPIPPLDSATSTKASVLDEIKAEVKLPQDNEIYNFYLNKQLGRHNAQEHLMSEPGGHSYDPSPPPQSQLNAFWAGLPNASSIPSSQPALSPFLPSPGYNPFSPYHPAPGPATNYSLPPYPPPRSSFDYYMPQSSTQQSSSSQPFQVPYLPPSAHYPSAAPSGLFPHSASVPEPPGLHPHPPPPASSSLPFPHRAPLSDALSFPPMAPRSDSLPLPPFSSQPPTSQPFSSQMPTPFNDHLPHLSTYNSQPLQVSSTYNNQPFSSQRDSLPFSSQMFESSSLDNNAPWRIIIEQAQNDIVMLHQISECLGRSIKECNDPVQLGILINMTTEVNSAALLFTQKQAVKSSDNLLETQAPQSTEEPSSQDPAENAETHNPEVAGFESALPVEQNRVIGRSFQRGGRRETTREHGSGRGKSFGD